MSFMNQMDKIMDKNKDKKNWEQINYSDAQKLKNIQFKLKFEDQRKGSKETRVRGANMTFFKATPYWMNHMNRSDTISIDADLPPVFNSVPIKGRQGQIIQVGKKTYGVPFNNSGKAYAPFVIGRLKVAGASTNFTPAGKSSKAGVDDLKRLQKLQRR
jgi:hypothetical protein